MADTTKSPTARSPGSALDLPMAALAGGSVGFFAWAMPANLFESLIVRTGLPGVLSAAQPPLGDTARIAFVAAAALASFVAVWLLLRALGKTPAARARPVEPVMNEAPRLRRADRHPDAPARQPVRAASDFGVPLDSAPAGRGEPVDVADIEDVDFKAEWERPAPAFLQPAQPVAAKEERATNAEWNEAELAPEPTDVPFWLPDGVDVTAEDEPARVVETHENTELPSSHASTILPFWAQRSEEEEQDQAPVASAPSLEQLSTRLEGGLIRRKREGRATRPRGNHAADDRLRGALDDLSKATRRR
ncbi:MAG TPA: hypothetical protein VF628_03125 [Allosphingosinicella sp.]